MRIAVLSDVHGNLPALEAVCDDLREVDLVVCAGDIVGYNPWPEACIAHIRERGIPCVMGNHDRAVAEDTGFRFNHLAQAGIEHAREELSEDALEWLSGLPASRTILDDEVRLVHGHPDDPDHYTYPEEFDASLLAGEKLLVMGHTHVQHGEHYDDGIVLNPGSVGQPRDGDPRAAYATVDLEAMEFELHRVAYDIDRVKKAIAEAGLPPTLGERLTAGR